VTAADLGDETPAPTGAVGPVARVSRAALGANAMLLGTSAEAIAPIVADGWGHGASELEAAFDRAGATGSGSRHDRGFAIATLLGLPGGDPRARPAMRLSGSVLSTKALRAGEGVSYGLTFRAPADTRVALVTGGYAQGVVRALGNRVAVSADGSRFPIVGRVAMDVCVVDIGDARFTRGDEVVFFGDPDRHEPALDAWCRETGLTALELVTAVGLHARREVIA
jgi:alanine racemase